MASNHGVVYLGPGKVGVQSIDYPELKTPRGKKIDHGVIIKPITTNICGSDQHMVRGRTTAPAGLVLGHEITGEVIECGSGVEFIRWATWCRCRSMSRAADAATAGSGHWRLPEREPEPRRWRLRLCRSWRMGGRTSGIRHGAICRFQPAQVPGQGSGDG